MKFSNVVYVPRAALSKTFASFAVHVCTVEFEYFYNECIILRFFCNRKRYITFLMK